MKNSIRKAFESNRFVSSIMGLGLGSSAVIGACGGLCGASALPLGALLASLGLGSVAIFLVKLRLPLLILAAIFGSIWLRNLLTHRKKVPAAVVGLFLGFTLIYSSLQIFFPLGILHDSKSTKVEEVNLQKLKLEFNNAKDKVRIVSLMSPGCDVCQRAFNKTIQQAFVQNQSENLIGFSVWLPWVWGDSRDLAGLVAGVLADDRALNFWDEKYELSSALTKTLNARLDVWDVYLIYAAGVVWTQEVPPSPTFLMHQLPEKYGLDMTLHLDTDKFVSQVNRLLSEHGKITAVSVEQ